MLLVTAAAAAVVVVSVVTGDAGHVVIKFGPADPPGTHSVERRRHFIVGTDSSGRRSAPTVNEQRLTADHAN